MKDFVQSPLVRYLHSWCLRCERQLALTDVEANRLYCSSACRSHDQKPPTPPPDDPEPAPGRDAFVPALLNRSPRLRPAVAGPASPEMEAEKAKRVELELEELKI
ncbi:hypothetical protein DFJ74DRAFT_770436 [Hyaloraphidium curvatum]|nr:hypothetical protein DFJ74DRAFT_770436 [Hyaloraphidium curvatum]